MQLTNRYMIVDYGLFRGDDLLIRGSLPVVASETVAIHGQDTTVEVDGAELTFFEGVVFRSKFEEPASSISIDYYEVSDENAGSPQVLRFSAAIMMGVMDSDEWETVELPGHTFAFMRSVHWGAPGAGAAH